MADFSTNQYIDFRQSSIDGNNQYQSFMVEIEGRIEKDKLQCHISNINSQYTNYLKVEKEAIIGSSVDNIHSIFTNIYYQIIGHFFQNPQEDSINAYIKIDDEGFKIANIEDIKNEKYKLMQVIAYVLNRDKDFVKVVIITKDINREISYVEEKFSKADMQNYNDIITNLSDIVSNLSHAWRQPLNSLNFSIINLLDEMHNEKTEGSIIEEYYQEIWEIIKKLSQEIEKFKAFFEMDYEKRVFDIKNYLDLVFEILEEKIKKENIKIDIKIEEKIYKYGSPNEFLQIMYCVFVDIIENCKAVQDIQNRKLIIGINKNKEDVFLNISAQYDIHTQKNYKLHLKHLSMLNNIIHKKMRGSINLVSEGIENKLIISFPLDI